MWRDILSRFFAAGGRKVLTASSCACAIEALKTNKADCVVLDFNLSDGNSIPVCAEIRTGNGRRPPIVMFSSDPAAGECVGPPHGAAKFILKTTPLEELLAAVNELLLAPETQSG